VIIKVEKAQLLSAQLFRAHQDARCYLNGLFFDKDGTLAATNGHKLFIGKHLSKMKKGIILSIKDKIPAKFDYAEINTKKGLIFYKSEDDENLSVGLIEVVNEVYPNYKRLIPQATGEKHTSVIGFNALYLSDILKAAKIIDPGFPSVKISMPMDRKSAAVFEFSNEEAKVILMPLRID
jgi:DNA polymerase III sliding clamp (beta) subunit (PCNA family)